MFQFPAFASFTLCIQMKILTCDTCKSDEPAVVKLLAQLILQAS
jgi:hypothetical protein